MNDGRILIANTMDHDPPYGVIFLNEKTAVVGIIPGQPWLAGSGAPANLSANLLSKIKQLSDQYGAYYQKDLDCQQITTGVIDNYVDEWNKHVVENFNRRDPIWLYVLFTDVDKKNTIDKIDVSSKFPIIFQIMEKNKELSYNGMGFDIDILKRFLDLCSEPGKDLFEISSQMAVKSNIVKFFKTGESLMWPHNWHQYPYRAGRLAKQATFDKQVRFLATRQSGVYIVDGNLLFLVRETADKNILR